MSNLNPFALAVLLAIAATGCAKTSSSKVDQSTIYSTYEATYRYGGPGDAADASTPLIMLTASFNVAGPTGTYLELDGSSQVSINGTVLTSKSDIINQVLYVLEKDGAADADASRSYDFSYVDNNGKQYLNTLTIPPAISVTNAANTTYHASSALRVGWTTPSDVATSETLTAYLEKTDGSYFVASQGGSLAGTAGEIVVATTSLAPVTPGNAYLWICRGRSAVPAQATQAGGAMTTRRCSSKVTVVFQ